jgi:hypothetical protein
VKSKVGYLLSGPTSKSYTTDSVDNHIRNVITMHTSLGQRTHSGIKSGNPSANHAAVTSTLDQCRDAVVRRIRGSWGNAQNLRELILLKLVYRDHRDSPVGCSRKRHKPHSPRPYHRKPANPDKCDNYHRSPRSPSSNISKIAHGHRDLREASITLRRSSI